MAGITKDYRCGYCLCSYDDMEDPRMLPCGHAYCITCLSADFQMRRTIKCPICKTNPTMKDVESLDKVNLSDEDGPLTLKSRKCPCDSCEEDTAATCFCLSCGLKYCDKHEKAHRALVGDRHETKSIDKFLEMPGRFQSQLCKDHTYKELSLACETCLKVVCVECELTTNNQCASSTNGNRSHTLRSFSYMLDKLTHRYDDASRLLADKNKEICRLEKIVWRRLGDISRNGDMMIEKIDKVTEEQIAAIRETSEVLKDEIRVYLRERTTQAEEYTAELLTNQQQIEDIQREITSVLRDTPLSDLIIESEGRQQRINQATQMTLKRCHLEERVLADKNKSREIELRTRSALPSKINYQTRFSTGSVPNSMAFIGGGKVVVGLPNALSIYDASTGGGSGTVNCAGLLKIAATGEKIYALRSIDNTKVMKLFSVDLQKSSDLFTVPAGVNHISAAENYLLVANTETRVLSVYDLDGEFQLELKLPETTTIQALLALKDGTVLVSAGPSVSRYRIGGNADPVWTCAGMSNVAAMCQDPASGLIICGNNNSPSINFLSLEGQMVKALNIMSQTGYTYSPRPVGGICVNSTKITLAGNIQDTGNTAYHTQIVTYNMME